MEHLKLFKKILSCLNTSKASGCDEISLKVLKDGVELLGLTLRNLANLSMKRSLFADKCKIGKLV